MKKLISILSALSVTSTSISAVVACSVPVEEVKIFVNGTTPESGMFDSNIKTQILSNSAYQVLNAVSYTEEKYQDKEKKEQFKEILGEKGLNLSIEKQITQKENKSDDEKSFLESFAAARNTKFTDFSFNTDTIGTYSIGAIKPFLQDIIEDKSQTESVITRSEILTAEKTLQEYADDSETNTNISKIKLNDVSLFGVKDINLENKGITTVDEESVINHEITDGFTLDVKDENIINEGSFYYSNVKLDSMAISYYDPGDKKEEETDFNINYTNLSGMVIQWQLTYATLSTKTEEKVTTNKVAYWFEPTSYQFTIQALKSNDTPNLFDNLNDDFTFMVAKK